MRIALFSYRYLAGLGPVPENIFQNLFKNPWLGIHVAGASTALLVGSFQFLGQLRQGVSRLHRWLGRIYVVGCVVGGAAGFILAFGASTGSISTAGFGLLAIAWLVTTIQGWRTATQRRFAEHRAWMIRSFALTFAAVALRTYLLILVALPIPFDDGYRAISFLCWVPNLLFAEAYLRYRLIWPMLSAI
jgi:uncharacterized membrane protein